MAGLSPPICDFGWPAPQLSLPGTDRKVHSFEDVAGPNGTLVMFICNHCPFVLAIIDRIIRDAKDLQALGIGVVGICSNDAKQYPADSFENMQLMSQKNDFPFHYLHDESQSVAKAYDAVCTPDFFGFNRDATLQYRGRLDASRMQPAPDGQRRDLFEAMKQVAETGLGPGEQFPSMGCSIKWKL